MTLEGKCILVTRAREQSDELAVAFRELGADVRCLPYIEIRFIPFELPELSSLDLIVFTSKNAVDAFFRSTNAISKNLDILCVGSKTAQYLSKKSPESTPIIPQRFDSEGIIESLQERYEDLSGLRVFCPQAREARRDYVDFLESKGAIALVAEAYSIEKLRPSESPGEDIDYVTFLSGRSVEAFVEAVPNAMDYLGARRVVVIGPVTKRKVETLGLRVDLMPAQASVEQIVEIVEKDVRSRE